MTKKFFRYLFNVISSSKKDDIGAFSAQSAFFMTISVIPFIMLLISVIKFLPLSDEQLIAYLIDIFPYGARSLIASFVQEIFEKPGAAVISITAVYTLWAASMGVFAFAKGLNRVFCTSETRNYFVIRLMSMVYTLTLLVALVLCLALFVFGNTTSDIIEKAASNHGFAVVMIGMRKILGVLILSAFFLLIYVVVPNRKTKILSQLPGALVSGIGWVSFSYLFSIYYENISTFSFLYGSLSVLVFFMMWVFVCIYILFIGAEINKCLTSAKE